MPCLRASCSGTHFAAFAAFMAFLFFMAGAGAAAFAAFMAFIVALGDRERSAETIQLVTHKLEPDKD